MWWAPWVSQRPTAWPLPTYSFHPSWWGWRIISKIQFKVVEGVTFQKGQGVVDLWLFSMEGLWLGKEVEFTLQQKISKFFQIRIIKCIKIPDLCFWFAQVFVNRLSKTFDSFYRFLIRFPSLCLGSGSDSGLGSGSGSRSGVQSGSPSLESFLGSLSTSLMWPWGAIAQGWANCDGLLYRCLNGGLLTRGELQACLAWTVGVALLLWVWAQVVVVIEHQVCQILNVINQTSPICSIYMEATEKPQKNNIQNQTQTNPIKYSYSLSELSWVESSRVEPRPRTILTERAHES